ncbi:hypothetical protein LCGC14_0396270 [marine sediment metagenome]|uniref:Uncharacterized protein n=1 Tax=marine sediment metagenome TaxID=412755 RepID=A0A0F9SY41_9ZZZZ
MKVEVNIPKGKYCYDAILKQPCVLKESNRYYCRLLQVAIGLGGVKHPDCPSLKKNELSRAEERA